MFISFMSALSQGGTGIFISGFALFAMGMALIRMSSTWMVVAAVFTIPSTYMAGDWSGVLLVVRLLPLTQLASAYMIDKEENLLAWLCALPTLAMLGYSLYDITVNQDAFRVITG